jgi:hypothetical protein
MIKDIFQTSFYYFSPIIAFLILFLIYLYSIKKIHKIKILPKDYLAFYRIEKKIINVFNIERIILITNKINLALINFLIKILHRLKIEILRLQIWVEGKLTNLKKKQNINQNNDQGL